MQQRWVLQRYFSFADAMVLVLVGSGIAALVSIASQWRGGYSPVTYIDLSPWALPRYTVLSAARGMAAYFLSLTVALSVGYWAAKSQRARQIVLPMVDVLQTIPVLGFLPGLVLGLITLFPNSNLGLELSAVIMIFTSQVWNMILSFYTSVRSVPSDLSEAAAIMGLSRWERFTKLELPFGAVDLSWNSVLSIAGGWFFLTVCESFALGEKQFRLPGIGSYMEVAIAQGNSRAMILGVIAMMTLIIVMDFIIWRPILAWVQRFRVEGTAQLGSGETEPLMRIWMRESGILRWIKSRYYHYLTEYRWHSRPVPGEVVVETGSEGPRPPGFLVRSFLFLRWLKSRFSLGAAGPIVQRIFELAMIFLLSAFLAWGAFRLVQIWISVDAATWIRLIRNTFWSLVRVLLAVALSTLWAVPVGIWVATSPRRIRIAQPIIQILASFPAPMLYPLALGLFLKLGVNFDVGSMFLIMLGVQWYVLFNVLAGAMKISSELGYALELMQASKLEVWRRLYLPSVFPSLVTGWVVAAGGAWNASIVAEYLVFGGETYSTGGLGASIRQAADQGDLPVLAVSLSIMVAFVLAFNRLVWERIYRLAQTRYRLDS